MATRVVKRPRKLQNRQRAAAKAYRFDARLNEDQKILVQRAADLEDER